MRYRVILGVMAWAGSALAAEDAAIARCTALEGDVARLACYDALFLGAEGAAEAAAQPATKPATYDNWHVNEEVSPVDDSRNVFLMTLSTEKVRGRFGGADNATLMIACRENTTSLWVHFAGHFMSDYQHGRVTYRIDKQKPQTQRFRESNNHEALGLWNGGSSIPLLKQMFGHETLFLRATPHSESAIDVQFDISGLEEMIGPLREACHW